MPDPVEFLAAEGFGAFGELIAPIATDEFIAEYWQKRPLLIRGIDSERFAKLLSLADIDAFLTTRGLGVPRIRMARGGATTIDPASFTNESGTFDPITGLQAYREGGTLILNHLHIDVPALTTFCQAISDEWGAELQCNVYVTPPASQGFPVHYDTHDVFIAQVHGSKRWKIYDSPILLPLSGQPHDRSGTTPGDLSAQIELGQGELLYIPRGFYHEATTSDCMSVHLTLGLMTKSWSELLLEAVSCAALEMPALRASPPPRFGLAADRQEANRAAVSQLLEQVAGFVSDRPLAETLRPNVLYPRSRSMAGHFLDVTSLDKLSANCVVVLRSGHAPSVLEKGENIQVFADTTTLTFPAFTADAVKQALSGKPIRITDLSVGLDEPAKILLASKLIEAGLLGLVRKPPTPRS